MRYTIYSVLLILAIVSCRSAAIVSAVANRFEDDIASSKKKSSKPRFAKFWFGGLQ